MTDLVTKLRDIYERLGYEPQAGVAGAVTYREPGRTIPQTVPALSGLPGFVLAPGDRPMTLEEKTHEGTHVNLGLPGAAAGALGAELLGVGPQGAYLAPDEVLAYLLQPSGEATTQDRKTINQIANARKKTNPSWYTRGYLSLIDALTR